MLHSVKTVLITGASSGLGEGMARKFAERGYNLALTARRADRLEKIKTEIESACDVRVEIAALDVNQHEQVFVVFDYFASAFDSIDRIIINAGVGGGAPLGKGAFNENLLTLETNIVAAFAQCEAAMKIFREQNHGHLVLISSMSGLMPQANSMAAYSTSKAAIASLGESLVLSTRKLPKIKVSTIYPGYIRTEINADVPKSKTPFIIEADKGCAMLVAAIEREPQRAFVPWFPWRIIATIRHILPTSWLTA